MTVYSPNESRTIAELQRWDMSNPANAPFVRIGRLLLAVDQTGAEAWQPLINSLKKEFGALTFMLYSGRHGALEGCFQDDGEIPRIALDLSFYQDDLKEANRFTGLAGVNRIEVVDSGPFSKSQYQQRVLTDTAAGHWVIVAWCHSIASMCTVPNDAIPNYRKGGVLWVSAQNMTRRRIRDVVEEDYQWVPRVPA